MGGEKVAEGCPGQTLLRLCEHLVDAPGDSELQIGPPGPDAE